MNVDVNQKREKNEKTGKREAAEKRKQLTDVKEAACYPSVVVQRAARQKNVYWDFREGQQPFRPNPNGVGGPHHHIEAAVNWRRLYFIAGMIVQQMLSTTVLLYD